MLSREAVDQLLEHLGGTLEVTREVEVVGELSCKLADEGLSMGASRSASSIVSGSGIGRILHVRPGRSIRARGPLCRRGPFDAGAI